MVKSIFNNVIVRIKNHYLFLILLISLLIRLFYLSFNHSLWWDSHVYIGMGKYIFSQGNIGIWESFRPLVHPFILGLLWKLRFDTLIVGKILDVLFSLTAVYLVYLVGKKVWNKKVALIAAIIFSLTPIFVLHTGLILTEPLAVTLGLLGVYLFLGSRSVLKLFFSGFLLALSFLTKFPQGIIFGTLFLIIIIRKENLFKKIKQLFIFGSGFLVLTIPYLIFNYFQYSNPFEPFIAGSWIVSTSTWLYGTGISYYLTHFFLLNFVYLFYFVYIYYFFKNESWKEENKLIIFLIPLLILLYFTFFVPRKESRYLVTVVPFLSLLVSVVITKFYQKIKMVKKPIITPLAMIVLVIVLILLPLPGRLHFDQPPTFENEIVNSIIKYNLTGTVLTSDPSFVSFLDQRVVTLDGMEFASIVYSRNKNNYDLIFINSCDFICAPGDQKCQEQKLLFFNTLNSDNKLLFEKFYPKCNYRIYMPKT